MRAHTTRRLRLVNRNSGFGLVEIMVGVAIGFIGVLVMMQVSAVFEGQKRTTTTGADAQTNGAVALYQVDRDLRRAGYGLSTATALGCTVNRTYQGGPTPPLKLTPVTITDGINGAPDKIELLASSKSNWSVPSTITTYHPPTAANIFLNTTLGISVGDMLILYEPGKDCTLIQATNIPNGNVQVLHQSSTSKWNPPGGQNIFPAGGYNAGASAFNVGSLVDHAYSIDAKSNLVMTDYSSTTNSLSDQMIASDIINMQAQYGFDDRPTPADARVTKWSSTMIDADGSGTVGDSGDLQRIYAVRIALVARSPLKERPENGVCNITTNNLMDWAGSIEAVNPAPQIDLSKNPDGSANADWKCYRYRLLESVIPLRNMMWR